LEADKTYEAVIRLGTATDTGDAEGEAIFRGEIADATERMDEALREFRGDIQQTPPMFSAIKHRGRPLYQYARQGEHIERSARWVRIYEIALLSNSAPDIGLRIRCSKGTYVRTLAHDLGVWLGCGAHLTALRRTAIGALRIEDAVSLAELEAADEAVRWSRVLGADLLLSHLPAVVLAAAAAKAIRQGKVVALPEDFGGSGEVRLYDEDGAFLGRGVATEDGKIVPGRMCADVPGAVGAALA
jgi:tRNA pseudouridine55 synthase